jgi:hypothetical protein
MKDVKELNERINTIDEVLENVIKKNNELENQLTKTTEILIQSQSEKLDTVLNELRNINNDNKVNQLFDMLTSITNRLDRRPTSSCKNIRILLFPENNPDQYYKVVFGRLIPWLSGLIILTYIFLISYRATEIYRYNVIAKNASHYEKAWMYLKKTAKRKTLLAMDTAYVRTDDKLIK